MTYSIGTSGKVYVLEECSEKGCLRLPFDGELAVLEEEHMPWGPKLLSLCPCRWSWGRNARNSESDTGNTDSLFAGRRIAPREPICFLKSEDAWCGQLHMFTCKNVPCTTKGVFVCMCACACLGVSNPFSVHEALCVYMQPGAISIWRRAWLHIHTEHPDVCSFFPGFLSQFLFPPPVPFLNPLSFPILPLNN